MSPPYWNKPNDPVERVLDELAETLRGPRRSRQRLLDEISEDFTDAIESERTAGLTAHAAEALVAARFGSPAAIATRWNNDQAERRHAMRRNTLTLVLAIAMGGALGITQYASGKNSPTPSRCPNASGVRLVPQNSVDCGKNLERRIKIVDSQPQPQP